MELNAESNRCVEGLQLRLEEFCQFFLDFELIYIPKYFPNYQSESRLQCPGLETGPVRSQKPEFYQKTVQILLGCLDFEGKGAAMLT